MQYTVVFKLAGSLAKAVAVEWTDAPAPQGSGDGWEPCLRLPDGRWQLSSNDFMRPEHRRDPGLFANIGIRYRLTPGGRWSPVSANRKEIVIVDVSQEKAPPASTASDWSPLEPLELKAGIPPLPSVGLGRLPKSMLADVLACPLTDFGPYGGAGSNSGYFGATLPLLAANSFAGDSASDARLLQNLRHNVTAGHDPSGAGGFVAQLELNFAVATAIARLTPRVWNQLTAAERTRLDIVMKGQLVANAFTSSDTNPYFIAKINPQKNLRGGTAWRTGNPNFRCAAPASVHAARVFLGSNAAVTEFLNNFNMSSFATLAKNNNLPAVYETYRTANRPSDRPTAAQVQAAIRNWKNQGFGIADITGLFVNEANFTAGRTIEAGCNNGAGFNGRGKIMKGAAGLPNRGEVGMYHEFDSSDAGGVRSSASYVMFGARVILNWALLLCAAGLLDRKAASVQAVRDRLDRAQTDLKYKSDNGYYSYSKGGEGSNNENWTPALAGQWGWSYSFGMWTGLLKPYLDAA